MKRFGKSANFSELPRAGGPGAGILFRGKRILFFTCLLVVGLVGPVLLIVAGVGGGSPAPVVFGALALGLAFGVGAMVFAGQRKLLGMMKHLADENGLTLSETPDLVPGLSHLSLTGHLRGRWITIAFENLPGPVTTKYLVALGKWQVSRKRQHLVVSVVISSNQFRVKGSWIDLSRPERFSAQGDFLTEENAAWLRERGCLKIYLGGGRAAMAWDARMTDEGLAEVGRGISLLVAFAGRLESASKSRESSPNTCPLCGAAMTFNPRYPQAVCFVCAGSASDAKGRALDFCNADFGGGFVAFYRDGGEKYDSHDCFIDGHACRADEARFGGIVVQLSEEPIRPIIPLSPT